MEYKDVRVQRLSLIQKVLESSLIETLHVDRAALFEKDTYEVKAISVGFEVRACDVEALIDSFRDNMTLRNHGFSFDGIVYECLRSDEDSIYGKYGSKGIILIQTHKHVVFGSYKAGMSPSVCIEACEKLADYLRQKEK